MYKVRFINKRNRKKSFIREFSSIEELVRFIVSIYESKRIVPGCLYADLGRSNYFTFLAKFESYVANDHRFDKFRI